MTRPAEAVREIVEVSVRAGTPVRPLSQEHHASVIRVVVDMDLHLPGMFEITFDDHEGTVVPGAGLEIGKALEVWVSVGERPAERLISGEVTALEGVYHRDVTQIVVRGYDKAHRLQRARRTRTFLNATDADVAKRIAADAGLVLGDVEATRTSHAHLSQVDETDWDFLQSRAREIGYETGMAPDGKFFFRSAASTTGRTPPVPLAFQENLTMFRPRVTAGNLASEVEVRVWDPGAGKAVAVKGAVSTGNAGLNGVDPVTVSKAFAGGPAAPRPSKPPAGAKPGTGNLGPAPSERAFVVTDRPVAVGSNVNSAAKQVLDSVAEHLGSTFAEAEGEADGNPAVHAGAVVEIGGVSAPFAGKWVVSHVRHVIGSSQHGYRTKFAVTGRQNRSLLGLTVNGSAQAKRRTIDGLVCGVVTNINDPDRRGRVKVTLPWLAPDYESDWAPTVQQGGGKQSGALFLHDVGDQVLVGFEFGDPRRPYVIGGIIDQQTAYDLGAAAVMTSGATAAVVNRGLVSPAGNRLVFHDQMKPDPKAPPTASRITLGTKDAKLGLAVDQVAGTVTVTCNPAPPNSSTAVGNLTVECGNAGTINIKTGANGTVNIDGGAAVNVTSEMSLKVESKGVVTVKGSQIKLN
ncbi:phage baseplate assembly protein V [Lentzea sp. NPDC051208]|uniref:phage baseplate assembly protein V n=1 Tax=Lentzea sp. NPDC051208 TaxID=3154642 RepID=UPI003437C04E